MGNDIDLKGRCAVVTGGAQGFGKAITERFIASGARVAIWDRDIALAELTAQALGAPIGPEAANGAGGALMQKFERGLMTYTPNVGISALDINGQIIFKNY